MPLSSPCEGTPCKRWSHGHSLLPTQLNVLSRQPDVWRDAFVGAIDGCHFDVHVPGFERAVRCWHHENLSAVLVPGEPIRIAGTLLRLPTGYVNVAADWTPPDRSSPLEQECPPLAGDVAVTDLWTGRGLDGRHLMPDRRLTVLIDDLRSFRDGRSCRIARTTKDGVALLRAVRSLHIDDLWLDHDLGSDRRTGRAFTIMPVVEELVGAAEAGRAYAIDEIVIHTSNPVGAMAMWTALRGAGYRVRRSTDVTLWRSQA